MALQQLPVGQHPLQQRDGTVGNRVMESFYDFFSGLYPGSFVANGSLAPAGNNSFFNPATAKEVENMAPARRNQSQGDPMAIHKQALSPSCSPSRRPCRPPPAVAGECQSPRRGPQPESARDSARGRPRGSPAVRRRQDSDWYGEAPAQAELPERGLREPMPGGRGGSAAAAGPAEYERFRNDAAGHHRADLAGGGGCGREPPCGSGDFAGGGREFAGRGEYPAGADFPRGYEEYAGAGGRDYVPPGGGGPYEQPQQQPQPQPQPPQQHYHPAAGAAGLRGEQRGAPGGRPYEPCSGLLGEHPGGPQEYGAAPQDFAAPPHYAGPQHHQDWPPPADFFPGGGPQELPAGPREQHQPAASGGGPRQRELPGGAPWERTESRDHRRTATSPSYDRRPGPTSPSCGRRSPTSPSVDRRMTTSPSCDRRGDGGPRTAGAATPAVGAGASGPSGGARSGEYSVDMEDLLDQHVAYYLRRHPEARRRHAVSRKRPGVYDLDGREVTIEWQYATEPGQQGFLVVVDGPLRQPFADYMEETEANAEYEGQDIGTSSLHMIPRERRISFNDQHKVYSRLEAMKVAKEQALVREKAAGFVKEGKEVPVDIMTKYKKAIQQKLGLPRRPASPQRSKRTVEAVPVAAVARETAEMMLDGQQMVPQTMPPQCMPQQAMPQQQMPQPPVMQTMPQHAQTLPQPGQTMPQQGMPQQAQTLPPPGQGMPQQGQGMPQQGQGMPQQGMSQQGGMSPQGMPQQGGISPQGMPQQGGQSPQVMAQQGLQQQLLGGDGAAAVGAPDVVVAVAGAGGAPGGAGGHSGGAVQRFPSYTPPPPPQAGLAPGGGAPRHASYTPPPAPLSAQGLGPGGGAATSASYTPPPLPPLGAPGGTHGSHCSAAPLPGHGASCSSAGPGAAALGGGPMGTGMLGPPVVGSAVGSGPLGSGQVSGNPMGNGPMGSGPQASAGLATGSHTAGAMGNHLLGPPSCSSHATSAAIGAGTHGMMGSTSMGHGGSVMGSNVAGPLGAGAMGCGGTLGLGGMGGTMACPSMGGGGSSSNPSAMGGPFQGLGTPVAGWRSTTPMKGGRQPSNTLPPPPPPAAHVSWPMGAPLAGGASPFGGRIR